MGDHLVAETSTYLPDNTQHSEQTNTHVPDEIRTHNPRPQSYALDRADIGTGVFLGSCNQIMTECLKVGHDHFPTRLCQMIMPCHPLMVTDSFVNFTVNVQIFV
jgi:hypothetical protein